MAWAEAVEALELGYELHRNPSETRTEYAGRLSSDRRVPSDEFETLADRATVARFHPQGVSPDDASSSLHLAGRIVASMRNRVPFVTRLQRQVDPRRLLKPGARIQADTRLDPTMDASGEVAELIDEPVEAGV